MENDECIIVYDMHYLYNKCNFNSTLNFFIKGCEKYNITFYLKLDDKYYIYNKKMITEQINILKNVYINHFSILTKNSLTTSLYSTGLTFEHFNTIANNELLKMQLIFTEYDNFEKIVSDVFEFKLLDNKSNFDMFADISTIVGMENIKKNNVDNCKDDAEDYFVLDDSDSNKCILFDEYIVH